MRCLIENSTFFKTFPFPQSPIFSILLHSLFIAISPIVLFSLGLGQNQSCGPKQNTKFGVSTTHHPPTQNFSTGSKHCTRLRFWPYIFFDPKFFVGPKIFVGPNFFLTQLFFWSKIFFLNQKTVIRYIISVNRGLPRPVVSGSGFRVVPHEVLPLLYFKRTAA